MKQLMMALALILTPTLAGFNQADAARIDHVAEAREHVNMALAHSQAQAELIEHSLMALEHVKMAIRENPDVELQKAERSLETGIKESQAGSLDKAAVSIKEALEYLDAPEGALGG